MSDYTDEVYDRYMITGEGAEYFDDDEIYEEEGEGEDEIVQEEDSSPHKNLNK